MSNLIPAGTYTAVAVAARVQWGTAGKNNTTQVAIPFSILDGEHAGKQLVWFGFFTDKTRIRTMEALRLCGWVGDDLAELGPLDQKVSIVVEHDEWDGKMRAKIAWVNQFGGFELKNPLTEDARRQFFAKMRAVAAGIKAVPGERVTSAGAAGRGASGDHPGDYPDVEPMADDDIPFASASRGHDPAGDRHQPGRRACP